MAVGMMLEHLGESAAAQKVDGAVARLLQSGRVTSLDARSGISTSKMGDMVLEELG
jgi:3-isopropylmalate dehydrogenase